MYLYAVAPTGANHLRAAPHTDGEAVFVVFMVIPRAGHARALARLGVRAPIVCTFLPARVTRQTSRFLAVFRVHANTLFEVQLRTSGLLLFEGSIAVAQDGIFIWRWFKHNHRTDNKEEPRFRHIGLKVMSVVLACLSEFELDVNDETPVFLDAVDGRPMQRLVGYYTRLGFERNRPYGSRMHAKVRDIRARVPPFDRVVGRRFLLNTVLAA